MQTKRCIIRKDGKVEYIPRSIAGIFSRARGLYTSFSPRSYAFEKKLTVG
ncbi:hypothetical protein ACYULU_10700 [Breznakiellaceae bacterium SP9]